MTKNLKNVLNIFKYRRISGVVRSKSCEDFYCGEPQKTEGPPVMAARYETFHSSFPHFEQQPASLTADTFVSPTGLGAHDVAALSAFKLSLLLPLSSKLVPPLARCGFGKIILKHDEHFPLVAVGIVHQVLSCSA
jgi:hypothetical protein